jgi:catechol 2,3-dioxygenase-like lactoylglutathione lyase family enzyme
MFKEIHPILGTRDIKRAIALYTQQLGFKLALGDKADPPNYVALSNSTCSFSSSMRWARSACGFWWKTQTHSSTNTVNGALSAIPTAFTILRGGRANLPSMTL